MSLFIVAAIACASLIAGLLVAMSEQIRAELRRRREAAREERHPVDAVRRDMPPRSNAIPVATAASPESRAAAYREILDALGDDLDEDIAEWEAVLQDFPQVIGAEEVLASEDQSHESMVETAHEMRAADLLSASETITPLHRTRRVSADERGMIQRLMRTGFAPEEIALWLNLPLERVQEFVLRD